MNNYKILAASFLLCAIAAGADLSGIVTEGGDKNAKVSVNGDLLPAPGDNVEIFFKLVGADDEISVATGKVTAVGGDVADVAIQEATGKVEKDQLARIKSTNPQKRTGPIVTGAKISSAAQAYSGRSPSFAFVDMNQVFESYSKTKAAAAQINREKSAAKADYDGRAAVYKSGIDEVNQLDRKLESAMGDAKAQMTAERAKKVTALREMEREINAWRQTREKELQDEALTMRKPIVADITAKVQQLAGTANLVLDLSGMTMNGVPVFIYSPPAANMSSAVSSGLEGQSSASVTPTREVKVALVDMNNVFRRFSKTTAAEKEVNAAKEAARKSYDERAETYKKVLAKANAASGAEQDKLAAQLKTMEREINDWRAAKEKELQEQASKKRSVIMDEITKMVGAKLVSGNSTLIIDSSGYSLNGLPVIVFSRQVPDFSDEIVTALNAGSGKARATTTPLASSTNLRVGSIDMNRAFAVMPEYKQHEAEINDLREKAKAELANADASTREKKEKEIQAVALQRRAGMVEKITAAVRALGNSGEFNIIFDSGGMSLNGVPLLVSTHEMPDLTDEVIARLAASP